MVPGWGWRGVSNLEVRSDFAFHVSLFYDHKSLTTMGGFCICKMSTRPCLP